MNDESHFTRAGHLSDLTIDRVLAGEFRGPSPVQAHLDNCALCMMRLETARAFDAQAGRRLRPPGSGRGARPWLIGGGLLALAAGVIIALRVSPPPPETDEFRLRGGFDLQVVVHDGAASRPASDGSTVHPGDRLRFEITTRAAGHVLILGRDSRGEVYLCAPQSGGGHSAVVEARDAAWALPDAMQLDDVLGTETLMAVFCPADFEYESLARAVRTAASMETTVLPAPECARRVVRLSKTARP
ncbi:MAG: hypothetical protein KC620_03220 [Myxococcales bacterium]|nr:hypothetical protein [Myxococcales bacterium]